MSSDRRNFLKKSALLGLSGLAADIIGNTAINSVENTMSFLANEEKKFVLPPLPYPYEALEPFIDRQTMKIHHDKHHQAYVDKLNAAVTPENMDFSVDDAAKCGSVLPGTDSAIRNNLGGHFNHSLFWTLLKPNPKAETNLPSGKLMEAITQQFPSFEIFKKEFSDRASKIFGSGWCWLIVEPSGKLSIVTTANQDNPLMRLAGMMGKPVLALDVWEHAYYLKYQNKRADYIAAWWNVVNWKKADELFNQK